MALRSRIGYCPPLWSACGENLPVPMTATARWSKFLPPCLRTDCRACAEALAEGLHSADIILNILARRRDPGPSPIILTPEALRLQHAPVADCARYDQLRSP